MPEDHDHLFKLVFSRPSEAASFLQAHLPPALAAVIDWTRLERQDAAFQVPGGTRVQADLLFSAPWRDPDGETHTLQLAILFEHQSTADGQMPLRLLSYMVRVFESQVEASKGARPVPVIPVVLYHGAASWTAPLSFADWLGLPPSARPLVAPFIPDFRYILEARRPPSPEHYQGADTVRVVRLLFDHAEDPAIVDRLVGEWRAIVLNLEALAADASLHPILGFAMSYLYHRSPKAHGRLVEVFEEARAPRLKEIAMTTWQEAVEVGLAKGRAQGRAEGRAEGMQRGAHATTRRLLVHICEGRFGSLSASLNARIDAADLDTLTVWAERAPFAATLDAVFSPVES